MIQIPVKTKKGELNRKWYQRGCDEGKKELLDKIWRMKFREFRNGENIDNYNNKKLGYYNALQEIRRLNK